MPEYIIYKDCMPFVRFKESDAAFDVQVKGFSWERPSWCLAGDDEQAQPEEQTQGQGGSDGDSEQSNPPEEEPVTPPANQGDDDDDDGEEEEESEWEDAPSSSSINVNAASPSQLQSINGVGPVTATSIIANRPYSNPAQLLLISTSVNWAQLHLTAAIYFGEP